MPAALTRIRADPGRASQSDGGDARIAIHTMMALATGKPALDREGVFEVVAEEGLEPPTRGL